jgi:hypothetical protein
MGKQYRKLDFDDEFVVCIKKEKIEALALYYFLMRTEETPELKWIWPRFTYSKEFLDTFEELCNRWEIEIKHEKRGKVRAADDEKAKMNTIPTTRAEDDNDIVNTDSLIDELALERASLDRLRRWLLRAYKP